jgi:hypothetical protein
MMPAEALAPYLDGAIPGGAAARTPKAARNGDGAAPAHAHAPKRGQAAKSLAPSGNIKESD